MNNLNIFRSCLLLKYMSTATEGEYNKITDQTLTKHNYKFILIGAILAFIDTVYQTMMSKVLRNYNSYYSLINTSYSISCIYALLLILVFSCKNIKVQRCLNYVNYFVITFPLYLTRTLLYVVGQIDASTLTVLYISEFVLRLVWMFQGLMGFTEGCLMNLTVISGILIYVPLIANSTAIGSFNIAYHSLIVLITIVNYFYTLQNKKTFYYNNSMERKNIWYKSILNNMNAGFLYVQNGKIKYLNDTMLDKIKNNRMIKHLVDKNYMKTFCNEHNIQVKTLTTEPNHSEQSNMYDYIQAFERSSFIILDMLLSDINTEMFSHNQKTKFQNPDDDLELDVEGNLHSNDFSGQLYRHMNQETQTSPSEQFFINFKSEYLNGNNRDNFKLIGTKILQMDNNESMENYTFEVYCRYYNNPDDPSCDDFEFIFNDVTRTKIVEQKNAEFRYKAVFLSKIAHEFKNPLICITELVNQIYDSFNHEKPDQIGLVRTLPLIKALSNYLLILVKDLDCFSQAQMGRLIKLEMGEADVDEIILFCKEVTKGLIKKNGKSGVKFQISKGENLPKKIFTDDIKIKQVLINLLSNAIKFTNKGTITLEITKEDNQMKIQVADTGSGISDVQKSNLFKVYRKGYGENNKIGAGLGLSIVSDLTAKLGTRINFSSKVGEGSKFYFLIPIPKKTDSIKPNELSSSSDIKQIKSVISYNSPHKASKFRFGSRNQINSSHNTGNNAYNSGNVTNSRHDSSLNVSTDTIFLQEFYPTFPNGCKCDPESSNNLNEMATNNLKVFFDQPVNPLKDMMKVPESIIEEDVINIIVSDDEMITRQSTMRILKNTAKELNKKVNVIESEDGIETLYIIYKYFLRGYSISCVISDETMNYMKGSTSSEIIKKLISSKFNVEIPFYLVTAYDDITSKFKDMASIQEVITKPLSKGPCECILSKLN